MGKFLIRNEAARRSEQSPPLLGEDQLTHHLTSCDKNGRPDSEPTFDRLAEEGIEQEDSVWQADEEVVGRREGDGDVDRRCEQVNQPDKQAKIETAIGEELAEVLHQGSCTKETAWDSGPFQDKALNRGGVVWEAPARWL